MSRAEFCAACKFFQETRGDSGECRKNPPTVVLIFSPASGLTGPSQRPAGVFPPVASTSWCGAFVEADAQDEGSAA